MPRLTPCSASFEVREALRKLFEDAEKIICDGSSKTGLKRETLPIIYHENDEFEADRTRHLFGVW